MNVLEKKGKYVLNSCFQIKKTQEQNANKQQKSTLSYQRFYLDYFYNIYFPLFSSLEISHHSFN